MKKLVLTLTIGLLAVSCIINIGGMSWVGNCTEEGIDFTDVRDVKPFYGISSGLPCNVYYIQANQQEVRVESTREFADKVLTTVEDGTLKLKLEEGRYPKLILRVVISSPDIESISISGSGNLIHEGSLHASKDLKLKVSGSGDILAGDIGSKDLTAHVSGSGSINASSIACDDFDGSVSGSGSLRIGTVNCDGFEATTSGSGHVDIATLTAKDNASARVSGGGHIRLHDVAVDGDMNLKTSGSGSILVNGRCHDVTASTSGSGNISGDLSYTGIHTSTSGSGRVNL